MANVPADGSQGVPGPGGESSPIPFHPEQEPPTVDDVTWFTCMGRNWPLRLDLATLSRFEKATGVNMLINRAVLLPRNLSMTACLNLLWAAMSQYDETLKVDDVGRAISPTEFEHVGDVIHDMLTKGLPDPSPAPTSNSAVNGTQKKTDQPSP